MAETTDQQANSFDNKPDEVSQNSDAEYSNNSDESTENLIPELFKIERAWSIIQNESFKIKGK